MNDRQFERLKAAEARNEMNAKAIHDAGETIVELSKRIEKLEQQMMLWKTATDHDAISISRLYETVARQASQIENLRVCSKMDAQAIGDLRRHTEKLA